MSDFLTDQNELIQLIMPLAIQHLERYGAFYPFGAVIGKGGKSTLVSAYDGRENPPSDQVIAMLTASLREQAKKEEIRASCICYDGLLQLPGMASKKDAIILLFEHAKKDCEKIGFPYQIQDKRVELDEGCRMESNRTIFLDS